MIADAGNGSSDDEPDDTGDDEPTASGTQRVDKWLWFTRVIKSRSLASRLVGDGKVRLNRGKIDKPSTSVRPGDVLTIAVHREVRVLKVVATGSRRGPAEEARLLYEDLTPVAARTNPSERPLPLAGGGREPGQGRPTKRDRRATDRLKS